MIGEMRLQWWRDVLEEIGAGQAPRKHEVAEPLAGVLDAQAAQMLDKVVAMRRWDLYRDPFGDSAHNDDYIDDGGPLMWCAGIPLLDGRPEAVGDLAKSILREMPGRGARHAVLPRRARAATLEAWSAAPILRQVAADPMRVAGGILGLSEIARRGRLLWWSFTV